MRVITPFCWGKRVPQHYYLPSVEGKCGGTPLGKPTHLLIVSRNSLIRSLGDLVIL